MAPDFEFLSEATDQSSRSAHIRIFASIFIFNGISILSLVQAKRRRRDHTSKSAAQFQNGCVQLVHAIFSIAAAAHAFSHRSSIFASPCDDDSTDHHPLFCFDKLNYLALDVHAGYFIYEWIFYTNNAAIIKPRFRYLGVERTLFLTAYALTKMHPCTLTLNVLPWYQLLSIAQGAEALFDISVALQDPIHARVNRLLVFVVASLVRAVGAVVISFYSWWWVSSRKMMHVKLPGGRGALNAAYCATFLGGGFILATIYLYWFRLSVELMKRAEASLLLDGRGGGGGGGGGVLSAKKKHDGIKEGIKSAKKKKGKGR